MKIHEFRDSLVGFAVFQIRKRAIVAAAAACCGRSARAAKEFRATLSQQPCNRSVRGTQLQPRYFDISRQFSGKRKPRDVVTSRHTQGRGRELAGAIEDNLRTQLNVSSLHQA